MKPNKQEAFDERLIMHPTFELVAQELMTSVYGEGEQPIVAVIGPPGVGKTALIRHVLAQVIGSEEAAMQADKEYIPAIALRTPAPEKREFPWRDCYHTMIEGLFDPASRSQVNFREYKKKPLQRGLGFEFPTEKYLGRGTKQTLYRHFLRVLEHRRPKAIIMDEAHHFVFGVRNVEDRMQVLANRLKSMADEMGGTKLVLVGTYDMHQCLEATTQGTRRLRMIEFRRYGFPDLHDASDPFVVTLCTLQDILDADLTFSLLNHAEEIYRGCIGCIGILKSWLSNSLEKAGGSKITLEIFRASRMKEKHLNKAMEEVLEGEAYMASLDEGDESLWQRFAPRAKVSDVARPQKPNANPFKAKPRVFKKGFHYAEQ